MSSKSRQNDITVKNNTPVVLKLDFWRAQQCFSICPGKPQERPKQHCASASTWAALLCLFLYFCYHLRSLFKHKFLVKTKTKQLIYHKSFYKKSKLRSRSFRDFSEGCLHAPPTMPHQLSDESVSRRHYWNGSKISLGPSWKRQWPIKRGESRKNRCWDQWVVPNLRDQKTETSGHNISSAVFLHYQQVSSPNGDKVSPQRSILSDSVWET